MTSNILGYFWPTLIRYFTHGQSSYWTAKSVFFWQVTRPGLLQITSQGFILKNSGQDLSNEGSNFILGSLEAGHWVTQK